MEQELEVAVLAQRRAHTCCPHRTEVENLNSLVAETHSHILGHFARSCDEVAVHDLHPSILSSKVRLNVCCGGVEALHKLMHTMRFSGWSDRAVPVAGFALEANHVQYAVDFQQRDEVSSDDVR